MAETLHTPPQVSLHRRRGQPYRQTAHSPPQAQGHCRCPAALSAKMTGLTLGDLSELDIELNIADSRTVTEVFREVVGGGDGSAVLGRGTAASAADAAE